MSKAEEPSLPRQSHRLTPTIDPDPNVACEDTGSSISRGGVVSLPSKQVNACAFDQPSVNMDIDCSVTLTPLSPLAYPTQSEPLAIEVPVTTLSPRKDRVATKRKLSSAPPATQGKSKKTKEKRDEIDEIFGF